MPRLTADLVTHSPALNAFVLGLVEEGPWPKRSHERELRRLQARLYNAVDAIIDGHVATKFPDSKGYRFVVRVTCYDLSRQAVLPFLRRFESFIAASDEYQQAISESQFVAALAFEFRFRAIVVKPSRIARSEGSIH